MFLVFGVLCVIFFLFLLLRLPSSFHSCFAFLAVHNFFLAESNLNFAYFLVLPNRPEELEATDIQARQLTLKYRLDLHLHFFPPGFRAETYYKSEYNSISQVSKRYLNSTYEHFAQDITDLTPYTNYDIKLRIRSNATEEESMWSDYANYTVRTLPDVPQNPPKTTPGSFEIVNHQMGKRNVYVYWSQIPDFERNGPNFRYIITNVLEGGLEK